jgi:hypothetical protein
MVPQPWWLCAAAGIIVHRVIRGESVCTDRKNKVGGASLTVWFCSLGCDFHAS